MNRDEFERRLEQKHWQWAQAHYDFLRAAQRQPWFTEVEFAHSLENNGTLLLKITRSLGAGPYSGDTGKLRVEVQFLAAHNSVGAYWHAKYSTPSRLLTCQTNDDETLLFFLNNLLKTPEPAAASSH